MIPHTHCQLVAFVVCSVLLLVSFTAANETYECAVEKRDDESVCIFRQITYTAGMTGITFKAPTGKIQHVAFEDSTLEHIPKELLSAFPNLRSLSVQNANLSSVTIPPKLERLYASNNQITHIIVQQTRDSTTMLELMLDSNRLQDVSNLTRLAKLEILNLSGNRELAISDVIELGRFKGLDRLRSLTLSDVGATHFYNKMNVSLPDLELLDLSNNNLKSYPIDEKMLAPFTSLQILRLAYMQFKELKVVELKESNPQLKMIYLEGNELPCKHLRMILQFLAENNMEAPVTNPDARCPQGFKKEQGLCCAEGTEPTVSTMRSAEQETSKVPTSTTVSSTTVSGSVRSDDGSSAAVRLRLGNSWLVSLTVVSAMKLVLF